MCEPLARLGFTVTGIDADGTALAIAREHAKAQEIAIDYRAQPAEALVTAKRQFDAVLALEVVEQGGALLLSTLNRTPKAYAVAILGAEYLLRWLPRGTHEYRKFRRPSELARDARAAGLAVEDIRGLVYDPWQDQWRLGNNLGVNYLLFATKPK
jgi:2-polyprenyl-6-hydroxyphenyl methylase/3-demethylubiquinone-9 3-methyltransferase